MWGKTGWFKVLCGADPSRVLTGTRAIDHGKGWSCLLLRRTWHLGHSRATSPNLFMKFETHQVKAQAKQQGGVWTQSRQREIAPVQLGLSWFLFWDHLLGRWTFLGSAGAASAEPCSTMVCYLKNACKFTNAQSLTRWFACHKADHTYSHPSRSYFPASFKCPGKAHSWDSGGRMVNMNGE